MGRISRIVKFEDYTTAELSDIFRLMGAHDGPAVDDSVRERDDFGNGRFVRNLYESARTMR